MALFEAQAKIRPGSRSNTKLEVSGHKSPAERWMTDLNLPVLFNYTYGGWAQKEVVIAKGTMVAVGPQIIDDEFGKLANTITVANGKNPVVGMAPYNITKHYPGFLTGNRPAIITEDYVELPYFPNADDAAQVKWGNVNGPGLNAGDLLKPDANGKLTKWVEGKDSISQICAQILAFEFDQEPFGWLKWAMWDETALNQDLGPTNKSQYQQPGADAQGENEQFPFDPNQNNTNNGEAYRQGVSNRPGYWTPWTLDPTGIPGILDGSQRALTVNTTQPQTIFANTPVQPLKFNLGLKNIVDNTVEMFIDGNPVPATQFTVELKSGVVTYTPTTSPTADQTVVFTFRANYYGTPAGWDFRGSVGACRLLLKF